MADARRRSVAAMLISGHAALLVTRDEDGEDGKTIC